MASRAELETNLTDLIAAQPTTLRTLLNSALALPNIHDTVFYGLMLRWPRSTLRFFQTGLPQPVALVESTDTTSVTSLFRRFAANLQQQGRVLLGFPSSEVDELRASFAIFLGQVQRSGETVPPQLLQMIAGREDENSSEAVVEQVEFAMLMEDAMGRDGRVYRNLSWADASAAAACIRDILAGRDSVGQDVMRMRSEIDRLVSTGVLRPLDVLVGEFRRARRDAAVNVLNTNDDTQGPSSATSYPGFQSSSSPQASSSDDDDAVINKTIFWTDIEKWLAGTRAGPRPRCFCFCSTELFVPELDGDNAAAYPDREPLRLLECMHVVGDVCMTAWKDTCGSMRCPWCLQL